MKWQLEPSPDDNCLRVIVTEEFSLEEQERMFAEIDVSELWRDGLPLLFNNQYLSLQNVDDETLRKSGAIVREFLRAHPGTRVAGVTATGINLSYGRRFEIFWRLDGSSNFRLFTDEREAAQWLLSD